MFWCVLTVDLARIVANHLLDHTLLLEVCQGFPGERAVDFQAVDEDGNGDEAVRLDILLELLRGVLVENDGVLGLVLDYIVMEQVSLAVSRCLCVRRIISSRHSRRYVCVRRRTLSLGPLLLLLLAAGRCWCHDCG